jgi:hypothetical protein
MKRVFRADRTEASDGKSVLYFAKKITFKIDEVGVRKEKNLRFDKCRVSD